MHYFGDFSQIAEHIVSLEAFEAIEKDTVVDDSESTELKWLFYTVQ